MENHVPEEINRIERFKNIVLQTLNELGGCDAKEEYTKGWDEAINVAYEEIGKIEIR